MNNTQYKKGQLVTSIKSGKLREYLELASWFNKYKDTVMTIDKVMDKGNEPPMYLMKENRAVWLEEWIMPYVEHKLKDDLFEI